MAQIVFVVAAKAFAVSAGWGMLATAAITAAAAYAGAAVDRMLFGSKVNFHGPRLDDLSIQTSTEGASLPIVYGTMRIAGNVIWSTGLTEASKKNKTGGGGSGGGGGSYTTYSYSTDCAVALCEGTITGIRRIWADTKLIYDASENATLETLQASVKNNIRFYTGSETQLCDPLIQAVEGTDLAYRGTAYVVFEDFQLADYGNRLPNFSFEVVKNGSFNSDYKIASLTGTPGYSVLGTKIQIVQINPIDLTPLVKSSNGSFFTFDNKVFVPNPVNLPPNELVGAYPEDPGTQYPWSYYQKTIGRFGEYRLVYLGYSTSATGLCLCGLNDYNIIYNFTSLIGSNFIYFIAPCSDWRHVLVVPTTISTITPATNGTYGVGTYIILDIIDKTIVSSGSIHTVNYIGSIYSNYATDHFGSAILSNDLKNLYIQYQSTIHVNKIDANILMHTYSLSGNNFSGFTYGTIFEYDKIVASIVHWGASGSPGGYVVWDLRKIKITTSTITLKSVVDDIISKTALPSNKVNFTALGSDTIRGYASRTSTNAANMIEPLITGYNFDLVEENGTMIAKKRGNSTSSRTINSNDLGATIDG
jgi:hypothetical protein